MIKMMNVVLKGVEEVEETTTINDSFRYIPKKDDHVNDAEEEKEDNDKNTTKVVYLFPSVRKQDVLSVSFCSSWLLKSPGLTADDDGDETSRFHPSVSSQRQPLPLTPASSFRDNRQENEARVERRVERSCIQNRDSCSYICQADSCFSCLCMISVFCSRLLK